MWRLWALLIFVGTMVYVGMTIVTAYQAVMMRAAIERSVS